MGCHTWFYKKVDVSYEEAKSFLIKKYKNNIDLNEKWISNPNDPEYSEFVEIYKEYTIDFLKHSLDLYKRKLRLVEGGYCKEAVMKKYNPNCYFSYLYISNKGMFVELSNYHDLFRIHNFPEDNLFSLEETYQFIETNKDLINYNNNWENRLIEFWDKYPDGMICFG